MVERMKKVTLSGTFCVGKTTMFTTYERRLQGNSHVAFVAEPARKFFQKNPYSVIERATTNVQRQMQELILQCEQVAHETKAEIILCDGSVLAPIVYLQGQKNIKGADDLLRAVEFWLPTYDTFLLLDPRGVPYEQDAIRKETVEQRERTHDAYLELFTKEHIPYELISGDLAERFTRVDQILMQT